MFVKLAVIACSLAFASAAYNGPLAGGQPADLYPAGVSPSACPQLPQLRQPRRRRQPSTGNILYNPVYPQQYAPAAAQQYSPDIQARLNRGEYIGDGDYRGEGLAEALAPGYAGQAYAAPAYNQYSGAQYAPYQQPAQLPAGLSPAACPNYPFCH
ncbi:hypothetical protein NQ315_007105 [Exocentrus adspersus]|uniref:Cuticle protein CPCFC domain-containing protein n=1 Tax=Exocentrus adspersus TaxID=1586481 RepID=A0AAV8WD99_9CUCU|nr:hypothetical protein NQ315_007105 [Exocentrus adspersus]